MIQKTIIMIRNLRVKLPMKVPQFSFGMNLRVPLNSNCKSRKALIFDTPIDWNNCSNIALWIFITSSMIIKSIVNLVYTNFLYLIRYHLYQILSNSSCTITKTLNWINSMQFITNTKICKLHAEPKNSWMFAELTASLTGLKLI